MMLRSFHQRIIIAHRQVERHRSSGATDGGTSARVFGSLISWMQEKKSRVLLTPHPPCQPASIPGSASIQLLQGWRLVRRSLEEGGCAPISSHRLDSTPN
jgi:hypothetical protein